MYVYRLIPSSVNSAHGGPEVANNALKMTPTRAGRFVVASVAPHVSSGRWILSTIPWGTPLRTNAKKELEVQLNGKWVGLHTLPGWRERYGSYPPGATALVKEVYGGLISRVSGNKFRSVARRQLPAPWNEDLPKTWVLNDFGQVAVKYFVDTNHDRKLDGKETVLSDFIHTTPDEELELAIGKKLKPSSPMTLSESHGCIHMLPNIMQDWVAQGILKVGATLVVHKYTETSFVNSFESAVGKEGAIEIHFYPRIEGIVLYKATKKQLRHSLHPAHG
ncbi:MAG: hypothetical protein EOO62_38710 [Hymenobacter sp.]|nr:MAG: hypothetical protein EOO62_38710 [Hymenobacter sp.]